MKMLKILISLIVVVAILFLGFDFWVRTFTSANTATREFRIAGSKDEGGRDSIVDIGEHLESEELIGSKYFFYYYAWRNHLRGKVLAGEYVIPPKSTLAEMTHLFTKGVIKEVKREEISVTFKEGLTLEEMAEAMKESNLPHEEFLLVAKKPTEQQREQYPYLRPDKSLEGFLFPDTYNVFPEATAEDVIAKMLANFDRKVSASMRDNITSQGKDLFEVITLASVVEGEVNEGIDRGVVAGIFQNRLDIDMPLQSDATIDYVKGIAEIKHTLADLEIDSPYNSYLYGGLPPGPINSPSLDSIIAAMSPSETDYLFFLNNAQTGETVFAETFQQHVINKGQNGL